MWKTFFNAASNVANQGVSLWKKNQMLDKQLMLQNNYVKNQLNNAASMFNREYYKNYLDTPSAQNMLKRVREQLGEQNRAMRNSAVVTGATPQAMAARQRVDNKALDSAVGTLAAADAQNKQHILDNYEKRRNQLNDYLQGGAMNYYKQKMNLESERYAGLSQFIKAFYDFVPNDIREDIPVLEQ